MVEVSVLGAGDEGRQLVLGEDQGAGLALGRRKFVVLEADQAIGRGERQAASVAVSWSRLVVHPPLDTKHREVGDVGDPDLIVVAPEHLDAVTRIHRSSSNDRSYRRIRPATCLTW
ncbi:MAG: hypothetical protein ABIZ05_18080 [Pseudonocardiaceae bacterium]